MIWLTGVASLFYALLFALTFFVTQQLLLASHFQTPDDIGWGMLASGIGWGQPDEHLKASNILYGLLLKCCYSAYPHLAWHACWLLASQFVSASAILYIFFRLKGRLFGMLGGILFAFSIWLYLLCNLQFTSTALLAGIAAVVIWWWSSGPSETSASSRN